MSERWSDESVFRDWVAVLVRRRLMVVAAVVVVPVIAFAVSHLQQALYESTATVLVNEQSPTGVALDLNSQATSPPDRYAATQAALARVGAVAQLAVGTAGVPGETAGELLASSTVTANPNADLLAFAVTDPDPAVAQKLATAYAQAYTVYRRRLDVHALTAAISDVQRRLATLTAAGESSSPLFHQLTRNEGDLQALQTLRSVGSSAVVVGAAGSATQVQPKTTRNVALGILVGIALGIALAFLRETMDTRVRSADEVRDRLGLPLLGHVPPPEPGLNGNGLAALSEPAGAGAEAFRILRTSLDITRLQHDVASIVITSTTQGEGKSTTAANLAVTLARSGRHVILLDLDLRQPGVDRFFDLDGRPGLDERRGRRRQHGGRAQHRRRAPRLRGHGHGHSRGGEGGRGAPRPGRVPLVAVRHGGRAGAGETLRRPADRLAADARRRRRDGHRDCGRRRRGRDGAERDPPGDAGRDAPDPRGVPGPEARLHRHRQQRRAGLLVRVRRPVERPRGCKRCLRSAPQPRPVEAPEIRAAMPAGPGLAVRSRPGPIVPFLAASDAIALVAAFIVTSLAIPTMSGRAGVHVEGLVLFAIALPGWFAAARLYGLYASEPGRELLGRGGEWTSVGRLMVAGTWLLLAIAWLAGLGQPATARLVVFAAVAVAFVVSGRMAVRTAARRRTAYAQSAVIVGAGDIGQLVARKLLHHPEYGIDLVGFVDEPPKRVRRDVAGVPVLGVMDDLSDIVRDRGVDRVIIAFSKHNDGDMLTHVRPLMSQDVRVDVVPRMFEIIGPDLGLPDVEGIPLVSLSPRRRSRRALLVKRGSTSSGRASGWCSRPLSSCGPRGASRARRPARSSSARPGSART